MAIKICIIYTFCDASCCIAGMVVPPQHRGGQAGASGRLAMDRDRLIAPAGRGPAIQRDQDVHRLHRLLCPLLGTLPSLYIMTIISIILLRVV